MAVAALEQLKSRISGKNVICLVTGANSEFSRLDFFKEHSLIYEGRKLYLLL